MSGLHLLHDAAHATLEFEPYTGALAKLYQLQKVHPTHINGKQANQWRVSLKVFRVPPGPVTVAVQGNGWQRVWGRCQLTFDAKAGDTYAFKSTEQPNHFLITVHVGESDPIAQCTAPKS